MGSAKSTANEIEDELDTTYINTLAHLARGKDLDRWRKSQTVPRFEEPTAGQFRQIKERLITLSWVGIHNPFEFKFSGHASSLR
jgi:hypothetical protein